MYFPTEIVPFSGVYNSSLDCGVTSLALRYPKITTLRVAGKETAAAADIKRVWGGRNLDVHTVPEVGF